LSAARFLAVLLPALLLSASVAAAPLTPGRERHFLSPEREFLPWSQQPERWFGALEFDTGFLYLRPRFELGYGKPHARWLGLETNPIFSDEGLAGYAGLRAVLPYLSLRVGGRYWYTFYRSFLEPRGSYTVEQIELRAGPRSRFLTWEAELALALPVGPGVALTEVAGSYVTGVEQGYYVYEETLRVIVEPPWVWRARAAYLWPTARATADREATLQLGPVLEVVGVPRRGTLVLRVGGLVRIALSGDLEARGTFVPAVATPDALGARGADTFLLGIRYRWASGP
jgi:hypothetical protein